MGIRDSNGKGDFQDHVFVKYPNFEDIDGWMGSESPQAIAFEGKFLIKYIAIDKIQHFVWQE